ncbi:MAG: bifunctional adenosylcobinamide kinase/adenosylcobinamide-phosphate guanylyltransferase [Filifactoraceae bacterium]
MGKIVLVTGGARSGKSKFAEDYCKKYSGKVSYIATAQILDDEMRDRVIKHREQRPSNWNTWEVNSNLSIEIDKIAKESSVSLLDCITIMILNLMYINEDMDYTIMTMEEINDVEKSIKDEIDRILDYVSKSKMDIVMVTNEVGLGIVPENRLSRIYRDIVGRINQRCGEMADEVYMVTCGIPIKIKG